MSASVYFYRIVEPQIEPVDGVIDLDELDYNTPYARDDGNVSDWIVEHGVFATLRRDTINMFDVGEQLFGKRPTSCSMHSYYPEIETFHFEDGTSEEITREELAKYYQEERFSGYVYGREQIGHMDNTYMIDDIRDYDECQITSDAAKDFLKRFMEGNAESLDDDYAGDYYLRPVYLLAKVMFEAENNTVICEVC